MRNGRDEKTPYALDQAGRRRPNPNPNPMPMPMPNPLAMPTRRQRLEWGGRHGVSWCLG